MNYNNTLGNEFIPSLRDEEMVKKAFELLDNHRYVIFYVSPGNHYFDSQFRSGDDNHHVILCPLINGDSVIVQLVELIAAKCNDIEEIKKIGEAIGIHSYEERDPLKYKYDFLRLLKILSHQTNYVLCLMDNNCLNSCNENDKQIIINITDFLDDIPNAKIALITKNIRTFNLYKTKYPGFSFYNMEYEKDTQERALVYFSYRQQVPSSTHANAICKVLDTLDIPYAIDSESCKYRMSIDNFEESIGQGYIVIAVVSDEYLTSMACMYELALVSRNGHMKDRLFPFVISNIDRTPRGFIEQKRYWNDRYSIIDSQMKSVNPGSQDVPLKEITRINLILSQLPRIWSYLIEFNTLSAEELEKDNYKILINEVKKRIGKNRSIF